MSAIAERYGRATRSSHLEVSPLKIGDIDVVMAAGMSDGLGVRLLRLRAEFDTISDRSGAWNMRTRLVSANGVRLRLIALIEDRGVTSNGVEMAAKLLDHWLSPHCQPCTGRGVVGDYGKPQTVCNACGGSTRRTLFWPADDQDLADRIAAEMEAKVDAAERRIRRLLRQG